MGTAENRERYVCQWEREKYGKRDKQRTQPEKRGRKEVEVRRRNSEGEKARSEEETRQLKGERQESMPVPVDAAGERAHNSGR